MIVMKVKIVTLQVTLVKLRMMTKMKSKRKIKEGGKSMVKINIEKEKII